jgi:hypothetical protein
MPRIGAVLWVSRVLAVLGLVVVGWVLLTAAPAVVHGHPAYVVMLLLTVAGCLWALWLHRRHREPVRGWRRFGSIALAVGAVGWLVVVAWLRPFAAQEPALTAMQPDAAVSVDESPTRIVMTPTSRASSTSTGVFFQPGAKVEARAYAAVLRPLAEAGLPVVIAKQPLGIGFLATGAFESAREALPDVAEWIVAGHSLGGTVASMEARDHGAGVESDRPVVGLLLHASYPASDISDMVGVSVVSVSGTNDGLATPADIEASKRNLPADAQFTAIDGAVHAFFGDYGPQPGDGEPTISHDEARTQISNASVEFASGLAGQR